MERSTTKKITFIILTIMLLGLLGTGAVFPFCNVTMTQRLVSSNNAEVFYLLKQPDVSLNELVQSIQTSGLDHVDQFISMFDGTLLNAAVENKRTDLVVWVLDHGANPNNGVRVTHEESMGSLNSRGVILPLFTAIKNEDIAMIRLLLAHNANPDLDFDGTIQTPRAFAAELGNPAVIEALGAKPKTP